MQFICHTYQIQVSRLRKIAYKDQKTNKRSGVNEIEKSLVAGIVKGDQRVVKKIGVTNYGQVL